LNIESGTPSKTVADGGYASQHNVTKGRENGVDRVVFNERCGLGFHDMGVQIKTFERLRDFRAGVEGNISELMSAYKAAKVTWRQQDGFCA
jgi:IS5 family transposase